MAEFQYFSELQSDGNSICQLQNALFIDKILQCWPWYIFCYQIQIYFSVFIFFSITIKILRNIRMLKSLRCSNLYIHPVPALLIPLFFQKLQGVNFFIVITNRL